MCEQAILVLLNIPAGDLLNFKTDFDLPRVLIYDFSKWLALYARDRAGPKDQIRLNGDLTNSPVFGEVPLTTQMLPV